MAIDSDLLLVLKSSGIGDGDPALSEKLMTRFLDMLWVSGRWPAMIICLNRGVFMTTQNSSSGDILSQLEKAGAEVFSCSTCLEYYGRVDKLAIGKAGNMRDMVEAMLSFKKVLSP